MAFYRVMRVIIFFCVIQVLEGLSVKIEIQDGRQFEFNQSVTLTCNYTLEPGDTLNRIQFSKKTKAINMMLQIGVFSPSLSSLVTDFELKDLVVLSYENDLACMKISTFSRNLEGVYRCSVTVSLGNGSLLTDFDAIHVPPIDSVTSSISSEATASTTAASFSMSMSSLSLLATSPSSSSSSSSSSLSLSSSSSSISVSISQAAALVSPTNTSLSTSDILNHASMPELLMSPYVSSTELTSLLESMSPSLSSIVMQFGTSSLSLSSSSSLSRHLVTSTSLLPSSSFHISLLSSSLMSQSPSLLTPMEISLSSSMLLTASSSLSPSSQSPMPLLTPMTFSQPQLSLTQLTASTLLAESSSSTYSSLINPSTAISSKLSPWVTQPLSFLSSTAPQIDSTIESNSENTKKSLYPMSSIHLEMNTTYKSVLSTKEAWNVTSSISLISFLSKIQLNSTTDSFSYKTEYISHIVTDQFSSQSKSFAVSFPSRTSTEFSSSLLNSLDSSFLSMNSPETISSRMTSSESATELPFLGSSSMSSFVSIMVTPSSKVNLSTGDYIDLHTSFYSEQIDELTVSITTKLPTLILGSQSRSVISTFPISISDRKTESVDDGFETCLEPTFSTDKSFPTTTGSLSSIVTNRNFVSTTRSKSSPESSTSVISTMGLSDQMLTIQSESILVKTTVSSLPLPRESSTYLIYHQSSDESSYGLLSKTSVTVGNKTVTGESSATPMSLMPQLSSITITSSLSLLMFTFSPSPTVSLSSSPSSITSSSISSSVAFFSLSSSSSAPTTSFSMSSSLSLSSSSSAVASPSLSTFSSSSSSSSLLPSSSSLSSKLVDGMSMNILSDLTSTTNQPIKMSEYPLTSANLSDHAPDIKSFSSPFFNLKPSSTTRSIPTSSLQITSSSAPFWSLSTTPRTNSSPSAAILPSSAIFKSISASFLSPTASFSLLSASFLSPSASFQSPSASFLSPSASFLNQSFKTLMPSSSLSKVFVKSSLSLPESSLIDVHDFTSTSKVSTPTTPTSTRKPRPTVTQKPPHHVTTTQVSNPEVPSESVMKWVLVGVGALILIGIVIVGVILYYRKKNRKDEFYDYFGITKLASSLEPTLDL